MLFASRVLTLGLIVGLPLAVLATVGLVYLIRRLAQGGQEPVLPKKKEIDRMKIEDL